MSLELNRKTKIQQWVAAGLSVTAAISFVKQMQGEVALDLKMLKMLRLALRERLSQFCEDLKLSRAFALTFKNPSYSAQWFKLNLKQNTEDLLELLICLEQQQIQQPYAQDISALTDDELMQEIEKLLV
jgi:hypothetical protein